MRMKRCVKKVKGKGVSFKIGRLKIVFRSKPKKFELLRIAKKILKRQEGK